jgi:hypothetical protein
VALFSRLLKLHSDKILLEDFFTEIVAYLLSTSHELLYNWLEYLGLTDARNYLNVNVSTQQSFTPLEHHAGGSRPDIIIYLSNSNDKHGIIFIESKVGSREGFDQLRRYAEILTTEFPSYQERILLYITRDYDLKSKDEIIGESYHSVRFEQTRWYRFYQFLQEQPRSMLIDEIITFMQENGMAQDNQFTAIDALALSNFNKAFNLMDATIEGKVRAEFESVVGPTKKSKADMWFWLREWGIYGIRAFLPHEWQCGLVYYLKTTSITDYPTLGIFLQVGPDSSYRNEIVEVMKQKCEFSDWNGHQLDQPRAWAKIEHTRSLSEFLSKEDHVAEIEAYFLKLVAELSDIKNQNPHLPWGNSLPDVTESSSDRKD